MSFTKMTEEQRKVLIDAVQMFELLEQARAASKHYKGSLHWKVSKGKEYLYRGHTGGIAKSLGARTVETEQLKARFESEKAAASGREKALTEQVRIHSGFIKAVRLNRFPVTGARVIRALQARQIPHRLIGTNALYVFEVAAGVVFMPGHIATADIDVLMDARQSIKIALNLGDHTLLDLLRKADGSFQKKSSSPYEFSAANDKGYQVDFLTQSPEPMQPSDFQKHLAVEDLKPVEIDSLKWHISSPRFEQVIFDTQGYPVRVATVDPQAFVLHKWFVSQQSDRDPLKKVRDAAQARSVASLLKNELVHLGTSSAIQRIFPKNIVRDAQSMADDGLDF
jgi:hypothetical protein